MKQTDVECALLFGRSGHVSGVVLNFGFQALIKRLTWVLSDRSTRETWLAWTGLGREKKEIIKLSLLFTCWLNITEFFGHYKE